MVIVYYTHLHMSEGEKHYPAARNEVADSIRLEASSLSPQEMKSVQSIATQIAETIGRAINPLGVGVVIEARHLCMMMRGVEKQHSSTITSSMLGAFREKETRDEFLALIQARPNAF